MLNQMMLCGQLTPNRWIPGADPQPPLPGDPDGPEPSKPDDPITPPKFSEEYLPYFPVIFGSTGNVFGVSLGEFIGLRPVTEKDGGIEIGDETEFLIQNPDSKFPMATWDGSNGEREPFVLGMLCGDLSDDLIVGVPKSAHVNDISPDLFFTIYENGTSGHITYDPSLSDSFASIFEDPTLKDVDFWLSSARDLPLKDLKEGRAIHMYLGFTPL